MAKKIFVDREYLEEQIKDKAGKTYVDEQDKKLDNKIGDLLTNKVDKNPTDYSSSPVSIGCLGTINTKDDATDTPPISDGWGTYLNSGGYRDFQIGYKWNDETHRLWYRTHWGDETYNDWTPIATSDEITALSNDRGYLNSKILTNGTDLNTIWENGIYQVDTNNCTNVPKVYGAGYLFVNGSNSGYTTQRFIYLDGNGTEYKRIKNGTWEQWSELATTDKIDISLLNGNKNELTTTLTPMASKSGNVATVNMTFEFYNPNICIVPFPPIVTTYFRAESLLSEETYRGTIYKDGRINLENLPANGTRLIINLSYPCV